MLFKKWFNRPRIESQILNAIETFREINTEAFKHVYSSDMSILQIHVCESNIVSYIELLTKLSNILHSDRMIQKYEIDLDIKLVYIRDFFLDKENNYIDVVSYLSNFINLCIDILILYDNIERNTNKTFNQEKNILLLRNVISNLVQISNQLKIMSV